MYLDRNLDRPGLTAKELFANMTQFVDATLPAWLSKHKALAGRYGLPLVAYEGGQHLTAVDPETGTEVNGPLKLEVQDDPADGSDSGETGRDVGRSGRKSVHAL